ncbi:AraC family transcriptional regulator [Brevibacillus nitrificans]|uniref:AraC family transcriptional regulator n=1 Tax=Brevibacillus nitrificans TaxID=651560 RepID=A0A3M8CR46_9BACL|nr:AraC family transcriptional regulator [Brevibacillus nitrificans]RNB78098.1 AraC family transcriptional regulator [Brevibacillus nitrificans]
MDRTIKELVSSGAKPILSSDDLGWSNITLSQWENIPPAHMYDASLANRHVIAIQGTQEPMHLQFFHQANRTEKKMAAGDIQMLTAGEKWSCRWTRSISFVKLEIDPHFLGQIAEESGFGHVGNGKLETKSLVKDEKLIVLTRWMIEEVRNGGASGELYSQSLATTMAVHLLRNYTSHAKSAGASYQATNQQVTAVIEYMRMNMENDISLKELALVANISLSYLVRLFKRHTGVTPHQYLIQLRMERAKQLIRCGHMSLKEIAAQIGLADQAHFTRQFKKATGVTPLQYASSR